MPVIFFDIDGVLADFVSAALKVHGKTDLPTIDVKWDFCTQIGFNGVADPKFWEPLGFDFWSSLGVYPDGLCLLRSAERMVGPENIAFLTSPCETPGCADGKRAWVARHFPAYSRRLFLGSAKHLFAARDKILVDDHDANIDGFNKAGGYTTQPPRPWNRVREQCTADGMFDVPATAKELVTMIDYATTR